MSIDYTKFSFQELKKLIELDGCQEVLNGVYVVDAVEWEELRYLDLEVAEEKGNQRKIADLKYEIDNINKNILYWHDEYGNDGSISNDREWQKIIKEYLI